MVKQRKNSWRKVG